MEGGLVDAGMENIVGTPVMTLGFTREELDAMDALAFPDPPEAWVHRLVTSALAGRCGYCDCGGYDPLDGRVREDGTPICWCGHTEMEHGEQ
jgi:hypothetical protein